MGRCPVKQHELSRAAICYPLVKKLLLPSDSIKRRLGLVKLFLLCYIWERIIDNLNDLRDEYLETKDPEIFNQIRCLLPSGYNQRFTYTMNYENVVTMIHQREYHRLPEWRTFTDILKTLPYAKEIMGE